MAAIKSLTGKVSRRQYFSEDTGYTVLDFIQSNEFLSTKCVGVMPDCQEGMICTLHGEWVKHPKWGDQFKFTSYEVPEPSNEESTIAYLETLKCCGESMARKIWALFQEETLKVFEETPERLLEVSGIGEKTLDKILTAFRDTMMLRRLISFLHSVGVGATYAQRIYQQYGGNAIAEIKKDPYILADQVRGFGFRKADDVALNMGIGVNSRVRLQAAIVYALKESSNKDGHCYLPSHLLFNSCCELLMVPGYKPDVSHIDEVMRKCDDVLVKNGNEEIQIWLKRNWIQEEGLADRVSRFAGAHDCEIDLDLFLSAFEETEGFQLKSAQADAVKTCLTNSFTIVTGGAGVGKSTISKAIIQAWKEQGKRVIACTPTGKAAQRLTEATGLRASTIHRTIGWDGGRFSTEMIKADAILVDEFSMVNLYVAYSLFNVIPAHAEIVLVGDVEQLPCIGAGSVLRDLINCGQIPVVRLTEPCRTDSRSRIYTCCANVLQGNISPGFELFNTQGTPYTDAVFLPCDREKTIPAIRWLLGKKLPEMGYSNEQIQVLSPMHKGDYGNEILNRMIQDLWNPNGFEKQGLRVGDRVIQLSNDYNKDIFNGDVGIIEKIDSVDQEFHTRFDSPDDKDGRLVVHSFAEAKDDLGLFYSGSVHKVQGSEFPVVVFPVVMSHYIMLQRSLFYTAISRGKKLVVLVGEDQAITTAIRTNRTAQRYTMLRQRLAS